MELRANGSEGLGSWWHAGDDRPRISQRVRYAVVGLGPVAQNAVLPAFAHARGNSELVALVSGDPEKLQLFGRKYRVRHLFDYHGYEDCLASGDIDAVYVALPNNQHREFTVRAARAGIHVLCEKPMAVDVEECLAMRDACRATQVKLMVGYRSEFDEAHQRARELVRSGRLGEIRTFHAVSSLGAPVANGGRGESEACAVSLLDLAVDCIHSARRHLDAEPVDVTAMATRARRDSRFGELEETLSAILRFPSDRLATFTCARRAAEASHFEVWGGEGSLRLDQAFGAARPMLLRASVKGRTREKTFRRRDPWAAQLAHFSECVLADREPAASADEGVRDARVLEALRDSLRTGHAASVHAPGGATRDELRSASSTAGLGRDRFSAHAASPSSA
jgi:glucose-fructose oxidoreductase